MKPFENDAGINIFANLDIKNWAEHEFGDAPLGDLRRSRRLVEIVTKKAQKPGGSYSDAVKGDWPKVKAYYRFIEQGDDTAVTAENILLPHRQRTIERMKALKRVLCIQDGTDLNFSTLDKCEGLGVIGCNQTSTKSKGLHLHSMLAITPEGVPLGILSAKITAPKPKVKKSSCTTPIEEKTSFYWMAGVRDCTALQTQLPDTSLVNIMDREADFFELFYEHFQNNNKNNDLIVRAKYNRQTTGPHKLFETVKFSPVQVRINVTVPRKSARPKKGSQKTRGKEEKRKATVSIRFVQVELKPPSTHRSTKPIPIWIVHAWEAKPPANTEPLEWFLLTTINIQSVDDALQIVKWYCLRWRVEDWHRVLKSGCKVEKVAHRKVERLDRTIAINVVIAWRIMLMTLLGREVPELPSKILFSDLETEVLNGYAVDRDLALPETLGVAVKLVAKLGGYLGRKSDSPPGHQIMWKGYEKLQMMCEGFRLGSRANCNLLC